MSLRSLTNKLVLAARLARRRQLEVGGTTYLIRGYHLWPLWFDGREWEPWLDTAFSVALRCREGAFLDVGAHVGQTMLKVLALESSRQYVGFEPQIICSSVIQKLIQDNRLTKQTILPIGLSTENKIVKLLMASEDFDATASVVESFRPDGFYKGHQFVCLRKGDEIADELELQSIAVIKIDVEGGELEVIEGLSNTIQKHQPFIVFEVLNFYLRVTNEALPEKTVSFRKARIERMEGMLRRFGYHIYRIGPGGAKIVTKIQPESTADLTESNYIAVPSESRDRFLFEISKTAAQSR
jgi:FkbM family methyltransferase